MDRVSHSRTEFGLVLMLLVSAVCPSFARAQLADTPWASYGGDARNTHLSPFVGPQVAPSILWSYNTPSTTLFQPVITNDGTIIFSTNGDGFSSNDTLVALRDDGTLRWSRNSSGIGNWAAADESGTVYFGDNVSFGTMRLVAVSEVDGSIEWTHELDGDPPMQAGVNVDSAGNVYLGNQDPDGKIYSVDSSGNRNWVRDGGGYNAAPAISLDGNVIVGGRTLRSYDAAGNLNWSFPSGSANTYFFSPSIDADGNVYIGGASDSNTETLYAFDADGNQLWSFVGAGGSTAIGPDGTIYAGRKSALFAINPDGTEKWQFSHGTRNDLSVSSEAPTIDALGNVYVTNADGMLFSLNPSGSLNWAFDLAPDTNGEIFPSMPVLGANGLIYIGTGTDRQMLALQGAPAAIPLPPAGVAGLGLLIALGSRRWWRRRAG